MRFRICLLLLAGLCSQATNASSTYQYAGRNYDTISDNASLSGAYTESMAIAGQLTFTDPLSAILTPGLFFDTSGFITSYSLSDGRFMYDPMNSVIQTLAIKINPDGSIAAWDMEFRRSYPGEIGKIVGAISSTYDPREFADDSYSVQVTAAECTGLQDIGLAFPLCVETGPVDAALVQLFGPTVQPGTWSVVPVPAAVWLFGSALGLLGWMRRKTN